MSYFPRYLDDEDDGQASYEYMLECEQFAEMLERHEALMGWQEDTRGLEACGIPSWVTPEVSEDDDPNEAFDDYMDRWHTDCASDEYDEAIERAIR